MKIFNFKRLLGVAAIYGAQRYVRSHGGFKAVFDDLSARAKKLMETQKNAGDPNFTNTSGRSPSSFESDTSRTYASYDLDRDDKLRH